MKSPTANCLPDLYFLASVVFLKAVFSSTIAITSETEFQIGYESIVGIVPSVISLSVKGSNIPQNYGSKHLYELVEVSPQPY
jgi:hypothetical protein